LREVPRSIRGQTLSFAFCNTILLNSRLLDDILMFWYEVDVRIGTGWCVVAGPGVLLPSFANALQRLPGTPPLYFDLFHCLYFVGWNAIVMDGWLHGNRQ